MSSYTISNLKFITGDQLAALIRAKTSGLSVIDVRDDDYIGGHIINSQNVPSATHDYRMPELVRTLRDQDTVVFHCSLSQQRGPRSALRYLREKDRLTEKSPAGQGNGAENAQKVYVLEGGFSKWQQT